MHFTSRQVAAYRVAATVDGTAPPRPLIFSLLALAPETPAEDILATAGWDNPSRRTGGHWTLLARDAGGLVVVAGYSDGLWDWRHADPSEGYELSADWIPLTEVQGLAIEKPFWDADHEGNLWIEANWKLRIRGRDPVSLHVSGDRIDAHRTWLRTLQAHLVEQTSPSQRPSS